MSLKPLLPNGDDDEAKQDLHLIKSSKPRKPFTKRKAKSANEINAWSNAEFEAGAYLEDEREIICKAVEQGLKAERLG